MLKSSFNVQFECVYSQTCLLRPPKGLPVGGLNREVVLIERISDFDPGPITNKTKGHHCIYVCI